MPTRNPAPNGGGLAEAIGMPEGAYPGPAAAYLASAPKSNAAYLALEEALAEVERSGNQPVPSHLRMEATGRRLPGARPRLPCHDSRATLFPASIFPKR